MRLLFVGNDNVSDGFSATLARSSYAVDAYPTADLAYAAATSVNYDVILLDFGLSEGDGMLLLQQMRDNGVRSPVIVLTDQSDLAERLRGLDAGADDCLVKPIALSELEARIRVQMRRHTTGPLVLRFATVGLDVNHRQAHVGDTALECTAKEFAVLEVLVRAQGRVVAKQRIFDGIYEAETDTNLTAVEVHVSRLRHKLIAANSGVAIRALRGLGYRLESAA